MKILDTLTGIAFTVTVVCLIVAAVKFIRKDMGGGEALV